MTDSTSALPKKAASAGPEELFVSVRGYYRDLGRGIPHLFEDRSNLLDLPYFRGGFVDLLALVDEAEHICDAGSGAGDLLFALWKNKPGKSYLGVDLCARAVELSEERRRQMNAPVAFLLGDLETGSPLRNGSFDLVLCHETLEHVVRPGVFIQALADLLRPGGRLLVVAPTLWFRSGLAMMGRKLLDFAGMALNERSLPFRYRQPVFEGGGGDRDAVYLTNPYELARAVRLAGCRVEKVSPIYCRLLARKV